MAKEISQAVPNLSPDSRYILRVRTVNSFGVPSEWSEAIDMTTDTIEPEERVDWGRAWGCIDFVTVDVPTPVDDETPVDIPGMSITTGDIPAGRTIKSVVNAEYSSENDSDVAVIILADGGGGQINRFYTGPLVGSTLTLTFVFYEVSTGGPITRKLQIARVVGTGEVGLYAADDRVAQFALEDLGPAPS